MKIAVAGATGRVGRHVMDVLAEQGHEGVPMSRTTGVDVITGDGLADALTGVDAIIDVATGPSPEQGPATEFFTTSAGNLQAAGDKAGVRRIVVVSIIGIEKISSGYNVAKLEHERLMREGPVPVRVLRAAQFHEFVPQMIQWGIPRMQTQLVAARSVAEQLVRMAVDDGAPEYAEIAGPRVERLVDVARLIDPNAEEVDDPDSPDADLFASGGLLPDEGAILAGPTFADWLDRPKATVEGQ